MRYFPLRFHLIALLSLVGLSIALNSCGFSRGNKSRISKETGQIPPDFGKEDVTMLVVLPGYPSYDKKIRAAVQKNYFGKYLFVTRAQGAEMGYKNDTTVFRYLLDSKSGMSKTSTMGQPGKGMYSSSVSHFILDRKTGKYYQRLLTTSFWVEDLAAYCAVLEKYRTGMK